MLNFLKKTAILFSEVAREFCEWCGLICSEGPCCKSGICSETTKEDCEKTGGVFLENSTNCSEADCSVIGACCIDGVGSDLTQSECTAAGGKWLGPEKSNNDCKVGACCEVDETGERTGSCSEISRHECIEVHKSSYQGAGTNCEGRDCSQVGSSSVECYRLESSEACKCGYSDYSQASNQEGYDPGRRWKRRVLNGNIEDQRWTTDDGTGTPNSPGTCGYSCATRRLAEYSGYCSYNMDPCGRDFNQWGIRKTTFYNTVATGGIFDPYTCDELQEPSFDELCDVTSPGFSDVVDEIFTPTSHSFVGTGACFYFESNESDYKIIGTVTATLSHEDTLFDAIARSQTTPECPRLDCDTGEFQGCERCPYDPEAIDCWKESFGNCTACTSSRSGACYNASTVRMYISIAGNTGGTVYVTIRSYTNDGSYDPEDPATYSDGLRSYDLDAAGPEDAVTCITDELEAGEGTCLTVISHSTTIPE